MAQQPLSNYLRSHRKRAGLSQEEVARLLGCLSGTKVSRYERFRREPLLKTVFACEAIFDTHASALFVGIFHHVRRATVRRAQQLVRRLSSRPRTPETERKLAFLQGIVAPRKDDRHGQPA